MSIELSEQRKKELNEIVEKMNKDAEMAIYYQEGTPEHERHLKLLLTYKDRVQKLEDHERTYVEQGLLDRKDVHDFYYPELGQITQHQKEKMARLNAEGKVGTDETYRIDGVR